MSYLFPLPSPVKSPKPAAGLPFIHPGHHYRLLIPDAKILEASAFSVSSGLLKAYRLGLEATEVEALSLDDQPISVFVWDESLLRPELKLWLELATLPVPHAAHNQLSLHASGLLGPKVNWENQQSRLSITPYFELEWSTAAFGAQLGWVQLVESLRTLVLEDGSQIVLLDTEASASEPVLYLSDDMTSAIKTVADFQSQAQRQTLKFSFDVSQMIPDTFDGKSVLSVSVLEKYTGYFMQNPQPDDDDHIWVPVHLPIVWGWSIRVQRRFDGVWDIFKKKLMLPTVSTDAPRLPLWGSHLRQCQFLSVTNQ